MEQSTETTGCNTDTEKPKPKLDISISTGKDSIASSGSVIIPENDFIEFKINNLKFRFLAVFDENTDKDIKPDINLRIDEIDGERYCIIEFRNFKNDTKMFFKTPIGLASFEQKSLKLSLHAAAFNGMQSINILMNYTWLLEK